MERAEDILLQRLHKTLVTRTSSNFADYRNNPNDFIKDVLHMTVWDKQSELISSTRDNRFTIVESGHATGKSISSAMLSCWWLAIYDEAVVVTLAPTFSQVSNVLWRYIRSISRKHKLPGIVFDTPRWDISPARYGIGLSPRKATQEDAATLQGYHSPNLLVIMDEAPGLPRVLWEAVRTLAVGENNHILAIGNPIEQAGPFWEACNSPNWHHIQISCLDHPNVVQDKDIIPGAVSRIWVDEMVRDHAIRLATIEEGTMLPPGAFIWKDGIYQPQPFFESRVLGRAPAEGSDQLISLSWVEHAKTFDAQLEGEFVLALDPARYGGDSAAMCLRRGNRVLWVKRRKPLTRDPSSEFAGWVKQEVQGLGGNAWVFIDEIGVGAGVLDNARRMGLNARGFAASKRSHQPRRFSNIRAECWWKVREKLQKGELSLPDDHLLTGDLTTARYAFDELGRIQLEDKDEMRKRLGRSPDSGDALAMTFASVALSADEEEPTSAQVTTEKSRWHLEKRATASRWKRLRGR